MYIGFEANIFNARGRTLHVFCFSAETNTGEQKLACLRCVTGRVNMVYARTFSTLRMAEAVLSVRTCCVDPRHDRGSYRMRFVASATLGLLRQRAGQFPVSAVLLVRAAAFSIITGGLGMCDSASLFT